MSPNAEISMEIYPLHDPNFEMLYEDEEPFFFLPDQEYADQEILYRVVTLSWDEDLDVELLKLYWIASFHSLR